MKLVHFLIVGLSLLIGLQACKETPKEPVIPIDEHGELTGIPSIDAITRDIQADPDNMQLRVARCEAYSMEGMFKEAEEEARRIYEYDETNWKAARLLAWAYFDNQKSKPAIKTLERALELYPDTIPLLLLYSDLSLKVKHYDEALIAAEKVLKLSSVNVEGLFMKGMTLKYMGDTLNAISSFQSAVELDADHFDSYMQLGDLFARRKKMIAEQYYNNALRIDSTSYEALKGMAAFYHQNYTETNGLKEKTKAAYERVILHHPQEVDASFDYGLFYMEEKEFEKALYFFDIATKYDPQFGDAYYFKGMALEELGRKEEAIRSYEDAVNNNNRFGRAEKALERLKTGSNNANTNMSSLKNEESKEKK